MNDDSIAEDSSSSFSEPFDAPADPAAPPRPSQKRSSPPPRRPKAAATTQGLRARDGHDTAKTDVLATPRTSSSSTSTARRRPSRRRPCVFSNQENGKTRACRRKPTTPSAARASWTRRAASCSRPLLEGGRSSARFHSRRARRRFDGRTRPTRPDPTGLDPASTGYDRTRSPAQQMALRPGQGGSIGTTGVDAARRRWTRYESLGGGKSFTVPRDNFLGIF